MTTKRNHVVPKEYLRRFAVPGSHDEMVWMYDRTTGKWTETSVTNAGVKKHFYHQDDETGLSEKVESPAQAPLKKLRCRDPIDPEERMMVAWYVYTMLMRGPTTRNLVKKIMSENLEQNVKYVKEAIEYQRAVYRIAEIAVPEDVEDLFRKLENDIEADPTALPSGVYDYVSNRVLYKSETEEGPLKRAKVFSHLAWRVIFAERQQKFLTSDNPVHMSRFPLGTDDPRFELVMPLGSECSLHICRQGTPDMLEFVQGSQTLVCKLNTLIVKRAERFVYSSRQEQWVDKAMRRNSRSFPMPEIDWGHPQLITGFNYGPTCGKCGKVYTKEELDAAEITYPGERVGDEVRVDTLKTIRHRCLG